MPKRIFIGPSLSLELESGNKYNRVNVKLFLVNIKIKTVDLSDSTARRLFIVEAVDLGARKSHLSKVLEVSRTTIDNLLKARDLFGIEGLVHGYHHKESKDRRSQRALHSKDLSTGNKARIIEQIEKDEKEISLRKQLSLDYSSKHTATIEKMATECHPSSGERLASSIEQIEVKEQVLDSGIQVYPTNNNKFKY
jgi:hypothetical protein